ncbi:hypothetical protein L3Q82_003127 [Scortum barcoo]|uniref:Uncharacterized protein n=1 Tax=Scortum barcoo TaxID=214431 RepID=A0ACB8VRJ3_9TELE|nr:hypothetical protein L3Q82_003127 [Scortum barcoo]
MYANIPFVLHMAEACPQALLRLLLLCLQIHPSAHIGKNEMGGEEREDPDLQRSSSLPVNQRRRPSRRPDTFMEMLEQSLDSSASHDKQETEEVVQLQEGEAVGTEEGTAVTITGVPQAAFGDHNVQYQFRTENSGGQVTYRVVQVTDDQLEATADGTGAVSVVSTAAFAGAPQAVAQAVIQNPFSNGGSPGGETVGGETRFAYFPAATVSDGTATAVSVQATDPAIAQAGGRWKVHGRPEMRGEEHSTTKSKGGILSKACDYIRELRQSNQRLQESYKEVERVEMDNDLLRQQIEELKNDNALLRAQLQQHGVEVSGDATPQT